RFGQAPVEDHGLAELAHHHVLGFQIAMQDAAPVGVGDRLADIDEVREQFEPVGEPAALLQRVPQRAAADQLLRVVEAAGGALAEARPSLLATEAALAAPLSRTSVADSPSGGTSVLDSPTSVGASGGGGSVGSAMRTASSSIHISRCRSRAEGPLAGSSCLI